MFYICSDLMHGSCRITVVAFIILLITDDNVLEACCIIRWSIITIAVCIQSVSDWEARVPYFLRSSYYYCKSWKVKVGLYCVCTERFSTDWFCILHIITFLFPVFLHFFVFNFILFKGQYDRSASFYALYC